jgi:hypothetical protein
MGGKGTTWLSSCAVPMHDKPIIKEFLRQVVASKLLDEETVRRMVLEFTRENDDNIQRRNDLIAMTAYFIDRGVLTCWQCKKLRHGHHHGFFVDKYKLLDYIGSDDKASTFLAEHKETGQRVALSVEPPPRFAYTVARNFESNVPEGR